MNQHTERYWEARWRDEKAHNDALILALHQAKAFLVIDQLSPAVHSFEIEKRVAYRNMLVEQIGALLNGVVKSGVCAKCGCETKGEVAWVHGEEWCHPCADQADIPGVVGKARE